jgi:hypothetical protein
MAAPARLSRVPDGNNTAVDAGDATTEAELAQLRVRVAQLEAELAEQAARANSALAAAQDRAYWLDRLGLDLNTTMRRPVVRAVVETSLKVTRRARRERGRLRRLLG